MKSKNIIVLAIFASFGVVYFVINTEFKPKSPKSCGKEIEALGLSWMESNVHLRKCWNERYKNRIVGYPQNVSPDSMINNYGRKPEYRAWLLANLGWQIAGGWSGEIGNWSLVRERNPQETYKAYFSSTDPSFDYWIGKPEPEGLRGWLKITGLQSIWEKYSNAQNNSQNRRRMRSEQNWQE